ncbi:hypothetical protein HDE_09586 [Halotydeus destructor]|nr:hypothetical protein HDE_09586 [Halotydeus destructor]
MSSQDTDFSCPDPNRLGGWWQTDTRGRLVRSAKGQKAFKPEAEFELMVIESCDVKRGYEQLVDQEDSILLDELLDEYEKDKHVEKWSTLKAVDGDDQPRRASKRELVGQLIRGVALIADEATRSRDERRTERNKPSEPSSPSRSRRIFNWSVSLFGSFKF